MRILLSTVCNKRDRFGYAAGLQDNEFRQYIYLHIVVSKTKVKVYN